MPDLDLIKQAKQAGDLRSCPQNRSPIRGAPILILRVIHTIYQTPTDQPIFCHTGEGRCPWLTWIPAFAGKTVKADTSESLD